MRIRKVWLQVIDYGADGGSVFAANAPEIDALSFGDTGKQRERLQVENGVPQCGAGFLAGSAPVGTDLAREDAVAVIIESHFGGGAVFHEGGHRRHLGSPPG